MTLSGTNVTQWNDKSGNGFNASSQLTAAVLTQNAINRLNSLLFNGTSRYLTSVTGFNNSAYTIFVVQYTTSITGGGDSAGYQRTLHGSTGNQYVFIGTYNGNVATFTGSGSSWNDVAANSINVYNYNSSHIVCMQVNGSILYPYTDGSSQTTKTGTTGAFSNFYIGNDNANTQPWYGYISEIIIYNSAITTTQREQIESYLAQKWGLTATLPSFPGVKGIPGCSLWLDAADSASITTSSGNLLTWNDKSGNGYVMTNNRGTTTVASSSLNSLNTVYTPSGTNTKITGFIGRTKCTMFLVGKAATSKYLLGVNSGCLYTGNDSLLFFSPPSGNYLDIIDSVGLATPVVSNNTWFILCIGYDNATNNTANPYTINGTTRSTSITPRGTPGIVTDQNITSAFYINSINGTNSYDSVYTAEIIYYNNTLTTTERQQIEGYLAAKWGLQSSLPNTHPYYTKVPINHINNTQPAGLRPNLTLATAQRGITYIPYPIT
jgi:hypothetical protein